MDRVWKLVGVLPMARRWRKRLLLVACVVPLLVCAYDLSQVMTWVGHTDLEIEFVVTEAGSGNPIAGAQVEVRSEGGFYEERGKQEFILVADGGGVARKVCRDSMCFGTQSGLRFTDTYAVHLPFWWFRVTAPGYDPSELVELDVPEHARQARKVGTRRARLVVPVSLSKVRQ